MGDPSLVLVIAAGILLAQFLAWLIRSFTANYLRTRSTFALAVAGGLVALCGWWIAALAS